MSGAKRAMADISVSERGSVAYQSLRRSYLSATTSRERMCRGRSAPEPTRAGRSIFAQGIFGQLSVFAIRMKALLLKLAMGIVTGCDYPGARLFQQRLSFSPRFAFRPSEEEANARACFPLCGSRAARTRATGDGSDRDKRRGSPERASPRVHHAEERAGSVSPPPLPVLHAALAAAAAHRRPISRFSRRTIPTPAADRGDDSSRTNAKLARFTSFAPRRSDDVHDGHFRTSEPPPTRRLFRRRRVRHPRGHHRGRGRG